MPPLDALFQAANMLALAGWVALLLSPLTPRLAQAVAALGVPLLLGVLYSGLVLAFWSRAEGGFGTLAEVQALFTLPQIALAGWVHYLAFDLVIGAWEVRCARAERIAFWLVVPCLVLTFLFGPAGFLAFQALRVLRRARSPEMLR